MVRWDWEGTVRKAEELVVKYMKGNDSSHDPAHVWRVRDLALSLARQEQAPSSNPDSMQIVSKPLLPFTSICNCRLFPISCVYIYFQIKLAIFFLFRQVELAALLHDIGRY